MTPLENKQRKSFTTKALFPLSNIPKPRPVQKQRCEFLKSTTRTWRVRPSASAPTPGVCPSTVDGKLEEVRPAPLSKLSSGSVSEPGHSSSSEGEKEFAAPEWDVPLTKNSLRE